MDGLIGLFAVSGNEGHLELCVDKLPDRFPRPGTIDQSLH